MKPINQAAWQAANTAERAGHFNRASGGRPTPTGRGTPGRSDIHQARQGGRRPCAWSEQRTSPRSSTAQVLDGVYRGRGQSQASLQVTIQDWRLFLPLLYFLLSHIVRVERVMSSLVAATDECFLHGEEDIFLVLFVSLYNWVLRTLGKEKIQLW